MFSSGKKEGKKPRNKGERSNDMANMLGLGIDLDIGTGGFDDEGDDDDDDFEAELAALQGKPATKKHARKKAKPLSMGEIDNLVSISTKGIDEDDDIDDDDGDDDEFNEEQLLSELADIAGSDDAAEIPTETHVPEKSIADSQSGPLGGSSDSSSVLETLLDRQKMYQTAIKNADSTKGRRLGRGLKQIESQIKAAKAGRHVDPEEIPPAVAVGVNKSSASPKVVEQAPPPAPAEVPEAPLIDLSNSVQPQKPEDVEPSSPSTKDGSKAKTINDVDKEKQASLLKLLKFRQDQYKLAARNHHKEGQTEQAKEFLMISKQFDAAVEAVQEGQLFPDSEVPPAPPLHATSSGVTDQSQVQQSTQETNINESADASGPPTPSTTMEGLQQRLEKYSSAVQKANQEGNAGKARRMGRIVKLYEDAVKMVKAGKPVDLEELPTPPGYPPIPPLGSKTAPSKSHQTSLPPAQAPRPQPAAAAPNPAPKPHPPTVKLGGRAGQQLVVLEERQKEFRAAALAAKKAGKISEAKEFLRTSKGLEGMIAAAQGGMRVDLSQVPPSPAPPKTPEVEEEPRDLWDQTAVSSLDPQQRSEILKSLQESLKSQMKICTKNAEHFSKIGDIPSSNSFQKMAKHCNNDLLTIKNAELHGDPPPKFHYEEKSFTIVRTNTDLSASEAEIEIIRGINLPLPKGYLPKDMYVYVSYEFPFPSEDCPTGYTQVVKHTVDPEFNERFKHPIDRKGRALGRVIKRQGVKLEIKYQRGFLKSDKTLGQATLKLAALDNKSEVHECLELLDPEKGRRPIGGKIEARVKLREPLLEKDVDIIKENWLIIDAFVRSKSTSGLNVKHIQSTSCQSKQVKGNPR